MAIDFAQAVYFPNYEVFARPVTFTYANQSLPQFVGRGIYSTQPLDVLAEDNSIFADAATILDIMEREFANLPAQGDQIFIPSVDGIPAEGAFEIIDRIRNGGGETTLVLRQIVTRKP